jgi:adenine-specific DNA-methyltransferase
MMQGETMIASKMPLTPPVAIADAARSRMGSPKSAGRFKLGQFMTPAPIAQFMAAMIQGNADEIKILDPGAGMGALTAGLVEQLLASGRPLRSIETVCYEIDPSLARQLEKTLAACAARCDNAGVRFRSHALRDDFVEVCASSANSLFGPGIGSFDCVVMNPPYRKIRSDSETRHCLRAAGIETSNLYSAFMLLGARQLKPGGEFVSITPRSFCNGPYFRSFRREFLNLVDLRRIHLFESRKAAFSDDSVLQENVIIYGVRQSSRNSNIIVSVADELSAPASREVPRHQIIRPADPESVIHILADSRSDAVVRQMRRLPDTLESLGISVSTGRVVDFRAPTHLRAQADSTTAPLIYSAHFHHGAVVWPNAKTRKPNAIAITDATSNLLVHAGFYVLTKRFSTKEEIRRVVAALFDPQLVNAASVGFDNKLNYFHRLGSGMDPRLARGLTVFLNSRMVDEFFRLFSGHTQVNVADLRRLRYPSITQLHALSDAVQSLGDQSAIELAVRHCL